MTEFSAKRWRISGFDGCLYRLNG